MTRVLSTLVALMLLAVPTTAIAQAPETNAPPGNSAVDEYFETVPGATGDRSSGAAGGPAGSGGGLSPAERARLERLGPDGKALADVIEATSPTRPTPAKTPLASEGRSPVSEVFDAAIGGGEGGMGVFLPLILLASLLATIALMLLRRRSVS